MAKPGRPSRAQSIANALELRETLQAQIVSRLVSCTPIRKVLVDMGKKVTLPELKHMAYAHILDVMNDERVKVSDRYPYIRLIFELDGDLGAQRGEIKHKHTLEFSEGTRNLLAARIKELMEAERKPEDVIDVISEGEDYASLEEKGGESDGRVQSRKTQKRLQEGAGSAIESPGPGHRTPLSEKEHESLIAPHD